MAFVDDRFRARLGLRSAPDAVGLPLADVLGLHISDADRRELASGVAAGRRLTLGLDLRGPDGGGFDLTLTPTEVDDIWVGALQRVQDLSDVRIESAALRAVSPAQAAQTAAATSTGSPLRLIASLLDGVRSLIGVRDLAGRYLLVNSGMAEFHGVTPSAFLGKTPEQLGLIDNTLRADARPRDGEPIVMRDVALTDATGRVRRFDVVSRYVGSADRSARYLLEVATELGAPAPDVRAVPGDGAAANAEARLDLVLRNGNLALIDWDVATDRIEASPQLAELLEVDPARAPTTGSDLSRYEHPRDKARVQTELGSHLDGKSDEYYCEYRLKTASGRVRWVFASGRVIARSPDGRPLSYRGTLRDITESIETEQELQRQLARLQEAIRASEDLTREVRQLESEIRGISQREHERIGHDLHDGLGQELTGVSLLLKTLEDAIARDAPQLSARVRSVRDMVEQSIATARALAQNLSPVHLDRAGFAGALEQLGANSEALYGVPVRFTSRGSGQLPELAAAADLYRIAQEAIRNAARHSGASEIRLTLSNDAERLVLTIEDDGQGMRPGADTRGGMGLKIMRYRASIVGASLDIGVREGGGTVVRCVLSHSRGSEKEGEGNE